MKADSAWSSAANAALTKSFRVVRRHIRRFERQADPRATHDLRVSIRRSRTVLQFFKDAWPEAGRGRLNRKLKSVAQSLGPLRDWEASRDLLKAARPRMKDPILRSAVNKTLDHAQRKIDLALESQSRAISSRITALSDEMQPALSKRARHGKLRPAERKKLCRLLQQRLGVFAQPVELERPGRSGSGHDWHIYRIRIKKFRYAAELARQCGCPELHHLIRRLRAIQETLGEFQDATVLIAHLHRSKGEGLTADEHQRLEHWLARHQQRWLQSAWKKSKRL